MRWQKPLAAAVVLTALTTTLTASLLLFAHPDFIQVKEKVPHYNMHRAFA